MLMHYHTWAKGLQLLRRLSMSSLLLNLSCLSTVLVYRVLCCCCCCCCCSGCFPAVQQAVAAAAGQACLVLATEADGVMLAVCRTLQQVGGTVRPCVVWVWVAVRPASLQACPSQCGPMTHMCSEHTAVKHTCARMLGLPGLSSLGSLNPNNRTL